MAVSASCLRLSVEMPVARGSDVSSVDVDGKVPLRDAVPGAVVAPANCAGTVAGRGSDVPVVDVVETVPVKGAVGGDMRAADKVGSNCKSIAMRCAGGTAASALGISVLELGHCRGPGPMKLPQVFSSCLAIHPCLSANTDLRNR